MLSVRASRPPASSIFIIIEVPERGSPDTMVIVSLFIDFGACVVYAIRESSTGSAPGACLCAPLLSVATKARGHKGNTKPDLVQLRVLGLRGELPSTTTPRLPPSRALYPA